MSWGRYSGFFFWQYSQNRKVWKHGPYASREDAELARNLAQFNCGKVFQEEKPVRF